MKKHNPKQPRPWQQYVPIAVLLLFTGSLISQGTWIWFLSGLSHIPKAWSIPLLMVASTLLWLCRRGYSAKPLVMSPITFDAAVMVAAVGAFAALVTQTHFLGDGYLLLSNLTQDLPLVRTRESVVMWLLMMLREMAGPASATTALAAYRAVAISSGVMSVAATLWLSRRFMGNEPDRRLFSGLLFTSGSMLLFFGYVENYPAWHLVLNVFGLAGVLASRERSLRWIPALLFLLALIIHPVSIALVFPTLYVLLPAALQARLLRIRRRTLALAAMVVVGGTYAWTQTLDGDWYKFRFAFLPLIADRFTVDGYTLLSPSHLLDFANLLLVLAPGILIFGFIAPSPTMQEKGDNTFLHLYLWTTLLLGFFLDPKLGMPRDWDLFAFVGTPVILFSWFCIIQPRLKIRAIRGMVASAIVVQAVVLGGRIVASALPDSGVSQAAAFCQHAPGRSRTGWNLLSTYYRERGDTTSYKANECQREVLYPEERIARASQRFIEQGEAVQAGIAARQALRHNPRTFEAWVNLGRYYRLESRFDSSLICMQIADGLNPYSPITIVELGMARLRMGDALGAEKSWLQALRIDSSYFTPYGALANLYALRGDTASQVAYLQGGLSKADVESWAILSLADIYIAKSQHEAIKQLLTLAEDRRFDSTTVAQLREKVATSGARQP